MKKIIRGKVYDTSTAQKLAQWENGEGYSSLTYVCETLYIKKTGEYFIHGEGGAMTQYAEARDQNRWGSGERIMPMAYKEAAEWAEKHLDDDTYENIFGTVTEDETRRTVTYSLSVATAEKIKRAAAEKGLGLSDFVEQTLNKII